MQARHGVDASVDTDRVTRREADVLRAVRLRMTNGEIAAELGVSRRTVESHVASLLRKFGVPNRHDLAARAGELAADQPPRRRPNTPLRPVSVASLDLAGVIVDINPAWIQFCVDNNGDPTRCGIGRSYLEICASADDELSSRIEHDLRIALAGGVFVPLRTRIPCHTPAEQREFDVLISSRVDDRGALIGASVSLSEVSRSLEP